MHRGAPLRPGRPVPGRPAGRRRGGSDPHAGRAAHRAAAARPGDRVGSCPTWPASTIIAQPHCHHYSVMGYGPDRALLAAAGATVTTLAGCCGLAGNFGMEKGHYDVSVAVAELALLPALRDAAPGDRLPGRRLLLPHPGRPARRGSGHAPGPDPRRPAPSLTGPGTGGHTAVTTPGDEARHAARRWSCRRPRPRIAR